MFHERNIKIFLIFNILIFKAEVTLSWRGFADPSKPKRNPAAWPDGIVLYHYNSNDYFTQEEREVIRKAFNIISNQTCVGFYPQAR